MLPSVAPTRLRLNVPQTAYNELLNRVLSCLDTSDVERARALALRFGWNATAFQIVNPGICHWFSESGNAVVGYVARSGVRVVAGAPVCAGEEVAPTMQAFEAEARSHRQSVCYFGAAERVMHIAQMHPERYSVVVLGAQPTWNPQDWCGIIQRRASLRAQIARAGNKGVQVREWNVEKAHNHPDLLRVLNEWLEARTLPPMHFLVEPRTLTRLQNRRVFVAERAGVPVGFTTCSPIPARNGWLLEQWVRGKSAPNGTTERMIDGAVRALAANGATYVTTGLVPLWQGAETHTNPLWLRLLLPWVRAHGRRFYNFDGLSRFKTKFCPQEWETIYAVANEHRFHPRTLYAIAGAFTGESPFVAVGRGLVKAVHIEGRDLFQGRKTRRELQIGEPGIGRQSSNK